MNDQESWFDKLTTNGLLTTNGSTSSPRTLVNSRPAMVFWAYVLRCSDGSFYAGHTEDLENRLAAHRRGTIPGYTSSRLPVELAWTAEFSSRLEALLAERQIKGWSHAKKQALIDGDWERLSELSRSKRNQGD